MYTGSYNDYGIYDLLTNYIWMGVIIITIIIDATGKGKGHCRIEDEGVCAREEREMTKCRGRGTGKDNGMNDG